MILCLHEWSVGFSLPWKVTCVKTTDRWTLELAVLQGQIVIALLLSHATVSERSAASLFHHILHINKTAREWNEGDRERERGRRQTKKEKGIQIDRLVARSVIVTPPPPRMDECLWWPLQVQAGRASETKRNWFGPSGGESMCEGHVSAVLLICAGLRGVVQSLRGFECDS